MPHRLTTEGEIHGAKNPAQLTEGEQPLGSKSDFGDALRKPVVHVSPRNKLFNFRRENITRSL